VTRWPGIGPTDWPQALRLQGDEWRCDLQGIVGVAGLAWWDYLTLEEQHMPSIDRHPEHTFCWAELATTDLSRARAFYSELFGWKPSDAPMPDGATYTTFNLGGRAVGGAFAMGSQFPPGTPPHWALYVAVRDADATARKIEQAGGKLIARPFDVMQLGRMSTFTDPSGAALSIWQPKSHQGFGAVHEEGAPCWFELITDRADRARDFYSKVFGWKYKSSAGYAELQIGDASNGGIMERTQQMGPLPPMWFVYFDVKSAAEASERAKRLGAEVHVPVQQVPDAGKFSVLADPAGAIFDVYERRRPR
jgi:predicted enzyme related to lactoylglutathione lyase